jgi:hypothetical protein
VVGGVVIDRLRIALTAVVVIEDDFTIADEHEAAADDSVAAQAGFVEGFDFLRRGGRFGLRCESCCEAGDGEDGSSGYTHWVWSDCSGWLRRTIAIL